MSEPTLITNALFTSGLQCAKRLYLDAHHPDRAPAPDKTRAMMAEIGVELVDLASRAFPKGVAVANEDSATAIERTRELCADKTPRVVFRGRFRWEDVEIETDILILTGDGGVDLFEVKAGVSIKPRHILDLALQVHVLEKIGYRVGRTSVLHLNRRYVHDGGKHPVHEVFKNVDATDRVRRHVAEIPATLDAFRKSLADASSLEIPTGSWCRTPLTCVYLPHCIAAGPEFPVVELPGVHRRQAEELRSRGIDDIRQLEGDAANLTRPQQRVVRALQSGSLVVEPRVFAELAEWEFPIHFVHVDFLMEILPRYAKSRPWQKIPFLWHRLALAADGTVSEASFVADGKGDPRAEFAGTLLAATQGAETVVYYPHDIEDRLRELVEDLDGEAKSQARGLCNSPFVELQVLLRNGTYHPSYHGEFDLATVRAALIGDLPEPSLDLADDDAVAAALRKLANTRTRAQTRSKLVPQLAETAKARTRAMFAIYQRLGREAPTE